VQLVFKWRVIRGRGKICGFMLAEEYFLEFVFVDILARDVFILAFIG
jgi:hypothetical protein